MSVHVMRDAMRELPRADFTHSTKQDSTATASNRKSGMFAYDDDDDGDAKFCPPDKNERKEEGRQHCEFEAEQKKRSSKREMEL